MLSIHHIALILMCFGLCNCKHRAKKEFQPWPQAEIDNQSIKKGKYGDPFVNALMNGMVEASRRAGFIYDGSKYEKGVIAIKARWNKDTVIIHYYFAKDQNGQTSIGTDCKCNGQTVAEHGDDFIMSKIDKTMRAVLSERTGDPYNPSYD